MSFMRKDRVLEDRVGGIRIKGDEKPGSGLSSCINNVVYKEGQSFGR